MSDESRVLQLLVDVLDAPAKRAPERLLASVLREVSLTRPKTSRRPHRASLLGRRPDFHPALMVGLVAIAVASGLLAIRSQPLGPVAFPGAIASPSPSFVPAPTSTSSIGPSSSAWAVESTTPVAMEGSQLVSGTTYTSDRFDVGISFRLTAFGGKLESGQPTDWCSPSGDGGAYTKTSPRTLVLAFRAACLSELRMIDPTRVDCGMATDHPNATMFAQAILANPGLGAGANPGLGAGAIDQTSLPSGGIAPTFFAEPFHGRVIRIQPARAFDAKSINPAACRIFGGADDPVVEIRADTAQVLVLLDIGDRLVVIRASPGGYDAPTIAAAQRRGYGGGAFVLNFLFETVRDVRFD